MKKLPYFAFFILVLFSCREQELSDPSVPVQDGKALRPIPPNDPNSQPDWNWESNWIVRYQPIGSSLVTINTVNPFFYNPIFGHADANLVDMRASEGWMLVARDFGTSTWAPPIPYIVLYNRYRGLLRVCALRTSDLTTNEQITEISFDTTVPAPDLFRFTGQSKQIAVTTAREGTSSGALEWMISEFNVQGYVPSINRNARFIIKFKEAQNYRFESEGDINLAGTAQAKPSGNSLVGGIYKVSDITSKVWDKLPEYGKGEFFNAVKSLTKKSPLTVLNAAAGLINSFTGGGKAPDYNISLKGNMSLDGTLSLSTPRGTVPIFLRGDATHNNQPRAVQDIPWGVMNYKGNTKIIKEYFMDQPGGEEGGGEDDDNLKIRYRTKSGFFNDILVVNPAIASDISKIEVGWIMSRQHSVRFMLLHIFQGSGFYRETSTDAYPPPKVPQGVAVRITFNNGDIIYNRFPVQYTSR
ncbi:hypothetical protein [Tunicatimonas pelagia]|uniref:hypothetical protein n=1 Tax=Tunicatimonas pelagia TaxID=931531 RepID=UPI0026659FCD|nr:hypothetical protein [Tunicatimonas pelagia]WKN45083.1 hypothetical protein P0M28_08920 [Tunicatimonas pelagia]